ncbi:MAG: hypothetical protein EOO59_06895, partial [Hymenobacter sp.]
MGTKCHLAETRGLWDGHPLKRPTLVALKARPAGSLWPLRLLLLSLAHPSRSPRFFATMVVCAFLGRIGSLSTSLSPSRWLAALLGLLLLGPGRAGAQAPTPAELRFEHITVDQGLSHSDAMCLARDRDGFLWVGTNRGLNRYDGYQLRPYMLPINPANGQGGNRVKALLATPTGGLWVGAERAGLSYYDAAHDTFAPLAAAALPPASRAAARRLALSDVTALAADAQGRLWVGTEQAGLFVLTLDRQHRPASLRRLPTTLGGQRALGGISSLAPDADGNVWVGTLAAGLVVVRATEPELPLEATDLAPPVTTLCLDRRGDLWVGTDQQVFWVAAPVQA